MSDTAIRIAPRDLDLVATRLEPDLNGRHTSLRVEAHLRLPIHDDVGELAQIEPSSKLGSLPQQRRAFENQRPLLSDLLDPRPPPLLLHAPPLNSEEEHSSLPRRTRPP